MGRFCGRIRQRKVEAKSCLGSMSDGRQDPWMRIQTHRMEPRRRIKYLLLQAVSVVIYLPIPCLAEVAAIPVLTGVVVKSPRLFAENSDRTRNLCMSSGWLGAVVVTVMSTWKLSRGNRIWSDFSSISRGRFVSSGWVDVSDCGDAETVNRPRSSATTHCKSLSFCIFTPMMDMHRTQVFRVYAFQGSLP